MRHPQRLLAVLLLAPTANRVISAGEHEIRKTRARDRAGSANAIAAGTAPAAVAQAQQTKGTSGGCGQRDEERGREESL
jgi:hypothetical protein